MPQSRGVTLPELLISLAVLGILATIAAPGFGSLLYDTERTTAVNEFFHALFLARSESIKRGRVVSLCKSADGETCSDPGTQWTSGWIVFVNNDRDEPPQRDPREPVLAVYDGWPRGHITSNRAAFSFRPASQGVVNGTVVFCDRRGPAHARAIIISHTGRPRVTRQDSSGKPLRCR